MKLDYYLIKYVDEPGTDKEWPIGIIANDGQKAHLRLLGSKSRHDVDHTPLCYLTGFNANEAWAWREWVNWFYNIAENEGVNPAGFEKVMTRLMANGTTITVEPGVPVLVPKGKDPSLIVDQLYEQHVSS